VIESSGILLLDKPGGMTSHDVVMIARRALGIRQIGHSGTLDPMATGLLILLVGSATKHQERFQGLPKTYSGIARLGLETDTGDIEGAVVAEKPLPELDETTLKARMHARTGTMTLPAPRYSAVKHKGKPLYDYARKGIEVEPKPRVQTVRSWELISWNAPDATFIMDCGSGTYVRAVAEALGRDLGCGATLAALRRESIGDYSVSAAIGLESFRALDLPARRARLLDREPIPALRSLADV
jgi:tRNA pseudouridine55 synthase